MVNVLDVEGERKEDGVGKLNFSLSFFECELIIWSYMLILFLPLGLSDQCKEIEENNRMGKTRDLFKKIRDTKTVYR